MDLGLKGKSAVITAASKGLGKATALEFAKEGAHILISSRDETELQKTQAEIKKISGNPHIEYTVCDVMNAEEIQQLARKAVSLNGTIDVLVNNAGGPPAGTFEDFEDEDWSRAFELNLLSFVRTIREVLPSMKKQQSGRIINIASSSIKQTLDNLILSNTFRAGIVGLSKSLSQELARDNILINTVGPGRIATDRVASLDEKNAEKLGMTSEEIRKKAEQSIPIGRYGEPEEFARAVVFLASEGNTYLTGQSLVVDGGLVKAL
ncbi:SDR family oxidoreductase [Halobacillus amylolyticus]|uniref:SDR family oxidoreductase n=1 Tax=Halobacillus amylolyticus TaxID=2932259 RepID=A0ABY4HAV6_9BACI|nr:SDR family oxidoreductase [Halobacillus amylolyticus]UOR11548.1 SDR family oxidoreductase [Halobacillus amylolyticus]